MAEVYANVSAEPYRGATLEGLRQGRGRYTFSNAFYTYVGEWEGGVMHGSGELRMADGGRYEGEFNAGAMTGVGMRRWKGGATYSGKFDNGEMHGLGTYISAAGEQHEGEYVRNRREGPGVLVTTTGDRYEGQFAAHKMAGEGAMAYADGGKYEGEWVSSERSGNGTMVFGPGDEYEGQWSADKVHGDGLFSHPLGYTREGQWVEGEPDAIATQLELTTYTPPAAELTIAEGLISLVPATPPPETEGGGEGGEGEEEAPTEPALPPISSLTLKVTLSGVDEEVTASTALASADPDAEEGDTTAPCVFAEPLVMSIPEGLPRPLILTAELIDAEGTVILTLPSGALTLDLTPSGETEGTLSSIQMLAPGTTIPEPPEPTEEEPEPVVIIPAHVTLSLGYSMPEPVTPLDPTATVTATTEEDLAALLPVAMVGSRMPFFCGSCVRAIERPYDPEKDAPAEVEDPKAKGKGKEPEPEPEEPGPVTEYFAVPSESGRELSFTLTLPEEVGEKRIADAAAAHEAALATYEEEKAAAIEAHTAAVAEAEASGEPAPEAPVDAGPPSEPPPPNNTWALGTVQTANGRLLVRSLFVPSDACSGPATLTITESTSDLALFALPRFAELSLPITLKVEGEEEPEPEPAKGKKK